MSSPPITRDEILDEVTEHDVHTLRACLPVLGPVWAHDDIRPCCALCHCAPWIVDALRLLLCQTQTLAWAPKSNRSS